jgi:TolA-binding protein
LLRFVLPVAATFFGSLALAASQGALPRLDDVREWLGMAATQGGQQVPDDGPALVAKVTNPTPSPAPAARASRSGAQEPKGELSLGELPLEPSLRAPVTRRTPAADARRSSELAARPKPEPDARSESEADATEPEPDVRPISLSADLRAYQDAHRLHFEGGDAARALAAWDAYLASYPTGAFAPEARLNRAACLIRLGRREEARRMLVPVAEGSAFAHGREQARKLLDAMGE